MNDLFFFLVCFYDTMNAGLCKAGEGWKILGNKKRLLIAGQGYRKMAFQKEKAEGHYEKEAQSERISAAYKRLGAAAKRL